ncbi:MAG: hypothetical protein IPM91_05665 [Bacteroidetes bacterium]|nr:hypothetical protein [Bacteroidota bacterium]
MYILFLPVTIECGQGGTFTLARTGGGAAIPGYYVNSTLLSVGSATSQGFIISDLGGNISDMAINGGTPFNPVGTGAPASWTATMWSGNVASSFSTAGFYSINSDSNLATRLDCCQAVNLTNWGTFNVGLGTINVANISWSSGGTGSVENVTPVASPTQYIVTLNDGICSATDTVNVNWFTTLPAPIGYDSTHCGNQQALCDVSTVPGAVAYRWYTTPTGGTPIQNLPDTNLLQNVAVTTTFYVAAFDGVCDGPRVAVTETVITPDPVDIVVTANDTICLGDVATLDATNANPNYVFIWSGNGVGTLNVNNVQTVVSTPLAVGNYTFIVTATDAGAGCVTTDTIVLVVNPNPNASANIDQTTICDGESVQLEVSGTLEATIGNNDAQNTNTSYPAAYGSFYWGHRQQILIRASELSAAGFTAGPINSLGFNITTADPASLTNYTISMAHTAATDLSLEQTVGSVVYGPVNYTAVVGVNTHSFTTPFNWDGTSNVVIQTCFNNSGYTNNSVGSMSNTSYISCRWLNQDAATVCTSPIASTASSRPQMILNGTSLPSGVTFSWSPATGLSATNISNPVATPSTSTTYVVTVTDPVTGCFTNDTVIINVLPVLPAPTTNPSAHCGNQIPTASVNAVPGATAYYWYDAAIGGTILQADPSLTYLSSIGTTTTLYVAAFDGSCLSPRTPVTITVATPPAITAQASDSSLCAGTNTINLDEILSNYITYTWSSDAGGNLNSTSGPSVTASPSAPGIYNYIVEGTDGVCTNSDTVTVEVFDLPTVNANIESAAFCEGGSVQLDVPTTVTIGENDVQSTTTGYPSAYGAFYWGYRMQNMILASELLANGFSAGAINALAYNIATPAGQTLTGYTIKMANVVAADLSTEQTVSTVVYGPVNYNSTAGLNTHTFSTPFVWDGVSNVVIETCFNNGNYTTNSVGNMDNTSFVSSRWLNQDAAGVCGLQLPVLPVNVHKWCLHVPLRA